MLLLVGSLPSKHPPTIFPRVLHTMCVYLSSIAANVQAVLVLKPLLPQQTKSHILLEYTVVTVTIVLVVVAIAISGVLGVKTGRLMRK